MQPVPAKEERAGASLLGWGSARSLAGLAWFLLEPELTRSPEGPGRGGQGEMSSWRWACMLTLPQDQGGLGELCLAKGPVAGF